MAEVLRDVINVANRAIHGESISINNSTKLIDTSVRLLIWLEQIIVNHALRSAKTELIEKEELDKYLNAKYKVTTITPYVDGIQKNIYTMNKAEIDAFTEGYNQYAEFIVEVKKI